MESKIRALIDEGKYEEALILLNEAIAIDNQNDILFFLRGRLLWKQGKMTEAMNNYAQASKINPQSPAAIALEQAQEIAQFFNPDLLNP